MALRKMEVENLPNSSTSDHGGATIIIHIFLGITFHEQRKVISEWRVYILVKV